MADDNPSMLLTNAGAALLARVMAGETLTFTRGAFGDSFQNGQIVIPTTDEQAQMEHLINERIELPLIKINPTGAYAEIDMQVESAKVDNSFMISEIGLFAKIGDEQEKLYGYFNAGLKGDYMPASHSAIAKDYVYTVIVVIGNAQNVTAIINKNDYELPTASATQKGGIKIGDGLFMSGDSLNASAQNYSLPAASESVLGGVKLGTEFSLGTNNKLELSGTIKHPIKAGNVGISLSSDDIYMFGSSQLSIKDSSVRLLDSTVKGNNESRVFIDFPQVKCEMGSGSLAADIQIHGVCQLKHSTIKTASLGDTLSVSAPVAFSEAVSLNQASIQTARFPESSSTKFDKNSRITLTSGTSVNATYDYFDLTCSSLDGRIYFTGNPIFDGTPVFNNGATGLAEYKLPTASESVKGGVKVGNGLYMEGGSLHASAQNYDLPTASTSTKGGVKIGTGLSMNGDTLNCTVSGGGGLTNPVRGTLSVKGGDDTSGGTVDASSEMNGGTINLYGSQDGGVISLSGGQNGGTIYMGGQYPGRILGNPCFSQGLIVGNHNNNVISDIKIQNGNLVITIDGTAYTFTPNISAGLPLSTVPSSTNGMMWIEEL